MTVITRTKITLNKVPVLEYTGVCPDKMLAVGRAYVPTVVP